MIENPEKFKSMLEEKAVTNKKVATPEETKKGEAPKVVEEKGAEDDGAGEDGADGNFPAGSRESARSKKSNKIKQKRPATDKQIAYVEFKESLGKKIEESIILSRSDIKSKRIQTKDLTQSINVNKTDIDILKKKLDKKEEERKMLNKTRIQDIDGYAEEDDVPQDDIIDEEELVFLKELKDLKRDYRDKFSKLKALKQELVSLQNNIDASKEQLIYKFENWFAETFESGPLDGINKPIAVQDLSEKRNMQNSQGVASSNHDDQEKTDDQFEDEDAAVYRRAKQSVDELHRARKFEKSIKL